MMAVQPKSYASPIRFDMFGGSNMYPHFNIMIFHLKIVKLSLLQP